MKHNQPIALRLSGLTKEYDAQDTEGFKRVAALKGLTLEITAGEAVGLIGSNGSGKSTTLKILSGIVKPTMGDAIIKGRVASILEIGGNFLPDLTGEENALLFLTLSGVEPTKAKGMVKAINEFTELGMHFHNPIKTYSNGMHLRLAIATSYYLDADIYLVDEVVSAGDQAFRLKMELYFNQLKENGKTLVIATHDTNTVLGLCDRCLWIEEGRLHRDDRPSVVVLEYARFQQLRFQRTIKDSSLRDEQMAIIPKEGEDALCHRFEGSEFESEHLVLREVFITGESHPFLYRQESIEIHIIIEKIYEGVIAPQLKLRDEFGSPVLFNVSVQGNHGRELLASLKRTTGIVEYRCSIPANWLSSGRYFLTVNFGKDVDPDQPLYNQRAFGLRNELCFHVRSREQEFISDPLHYSFNPELVWGILYQTAG